MNDQAYIKIIKMLNNNADLGSENIIKISFCQRRDSLIYHIENITESQKYQHKNICLPESVVKTIFNATHNSEHPDFLLMFKIISSS